MPSKPPQVFGRLSAQRDETNLVDLHVHTTASDGMYAPDELVNLAHRSGLKVVAVTDHDTVSGVGPASDAAKKIPLEVIAGIELSTETPRGEFHILGYFIDTENAELNRTLQAIREARWDRARRMAAKLSELGLPLDWNHLVEIEGGGVIGRPHVAQAMVDAGYVASIPEAFERFLGQGGPAYVERYKLSPEHAISLIAGSGGVSSLAHPGDSVALASTLPELARAGLAGLEAFYRGYSDGLVDTLVALADRYHLVATGGSDYHGWPTMGEEGLGRLYVPLSAVERLRALARHS
jgi:3',5'-nucleoside bisphosphate phosphatase